MEKYQFDDAEFAHLEASPIPLAVYQLIDKRVVILVLSAGFLKLFELERDEAYDLMDHDMYRDTHPDDAARIADAAFRFATENVEYSAVYRTKVADGYRIVRARGEHVYLDDGVRLAYVWYTDEGLCDEDNGQFEGALNKALGKMLEEEARYQRYSYDRLTGLPTMTYFYELADAGKASLISEGKQPVLLFFNLSGMKHYNRKFGFDEGDQLLSSVAKTLVRHFGSENCSRIGKDHFAVLTSNDDLEDELLDLFDECESLNGRNSLPIRVGIYLDKGNDLTIGDACDRAQYACKLAGGTYVSEYRFFTEDMLVEADEKRYIVENIDRAINEQWIQVYYQAIVRAASGQVCDEEALSRWIDPEKGMLSPDKFIPALEDAKIIYKLDLHVINQVLKKMKDQADEGLYVVPQSVNLSRSDFDALDMVEEIRWRVDAAGIPRDKLNIEITESVVGQDFEFMKEQVARFQELGFNVWMDDFGSGYSSLDVLQFIPFDVIKLDMHFLREFENGEKSKIILTELVKMAIGLGIDTVAEGVETEEQAEFLKEIGCSRLQGFHYTKPIPLEEIVSRKKSDKLIGFENPDEAEYYATIGKVNLYDMAVIAKDDDKSFKRYFDTIPMAIYELGVDEYHIARTNQSYRDFMKRAFDVTMVSSGVSLPQPKEGLVDSFMAALQQCAANGSTQVVDEETAEHETTHSIIKRIAVNPVTGAAAVVVAVLAVVDSEDYRTAVTYANIAQSLSSDYSYLYYVNLETEEFIEYSSAGSGDGLSRERSGTNFFQASRDDARKILYEPDQERFIQSFTKQNVVDTMDAQGSFILSYRMLVDGEPRSMLMKAVRVSGVENHIIIGVNNVDAQVKQREILKQMRAEQIAYSRIVALLDDYFCIYIVELPSEHYAVYSASSDFEGLNFAKEGENFFAQAAENSLHALLIDDRAMFASSFTKENVLEAIKRNGSFNLTYSLIIDGIPTEVALKAVLIEEQDATRLVIGVR